MPRGFKITYNSPVVLTFALAATVVHLLGEEAKMHFVARPDLENFGDYLALFTHILGHGSWEHLMSNMTMILLLGPILEERHGSGSLLIMVLLTAAITGLLNALVFNDYILGASGIVFMFILLASTANIKSRQIPLSFIAVAVLFLGGELIAAFRDDQISQMAHLVGGLTGAVFGFSIAHRSRSSSSGAARTS